MRTVWRVFVCSLVMVSVVLPSAARQSTIRVVEDAQFVDSGQALGNADSSGVALGDLDGDLDLDAFVANYNAPSEVWVNQGGNQGGSQGTFVDSGQSLGNGAALDVELADLDGDLDLDAFVIVDAFTASLQIWINQGGAQAGTQGVFQPNGQTIGAEINSRVALGNVDGIAGVDAFVARYIGRPSQVWHNDGSGLFSDTGQTLDTDSADVALGDLDGDNDLDAFSANGAANKVWVNLGGDQAGTEGVYLDSGQALGSALANSVALGDIDGDDDLDALTTDYGANKVWINQGGYQVGTEGVFAAAGQTLGSAVLLDVALADLDGDVDLDAFTTTGGGNLVWINQGGSQGGTQGVFVDNGQSLGDLYSTAVALGDVDGDGDDDAFVANYYAPNRVWLNQSAASPINPEGWQVQVVDARGDTGRSGSLALDANGYPHIAYVRYAPVTSGNDYQLYYSRWDGVRWHTELVHRAPVIGGGSNAYLSLALDAQEAPHIAFTAGQNIGLAALYYASRNGGQWQVTLVDDSHFLEDQVALALDASGNPRIAYFTTDGDHALLFASRDAGTWQIEVVDDTVTTLFGLYPSLAVDASGRPHISYVDVPGDTMKYAVNDGLGWQIDVVENVPYSGFEAYTSLVLDANGYPNIAYVWADGQDLRLAQWNGSMWQKQTVYTAPGISTVDERVSLGLDSSGRPHITYVETLNDSAMLEYVHWDGASWQHETLDNSGLDVGRFQAMALDANDRLHVGYYDGTFGDLRYLTWAPDWLFTPVNDPGLVSSPGLGVKDGVPYLSYYNQGSGQIQLARWDGAWGLSPAAFVSNPAANVSLAVGASRQHLSYYDADNQRLVYGAWNGLTWDTQVVDEVGDVGRYNDVLLVGQADALVRIAYWDATNLQVKLAVRLPMSNTWQSLVDSAGPALDADSGPLSAALLPGADVGISYYDGLNGDLRLATWHRLSNTWTDELIDGLLGADLGRLSSLQTDGTDGFPVVAYYDETNDAIKYAYKDGGGWQIETAVPGAGGVTSLSLALGLNSRLRGRIAYTTGAGDDLRLAVLRDGTWQIEAIERGTGAAFDEAALALGSQPYLAYVAAGAGPQFALRAATLDVDPAVPGGPPRRTGGYYNPLDACQAVLELFIPDSRAVAAPPPRPLLALAAGSTSLDDLSIFGAITSVFAGTAEGQAYLGLYAQYGSEMGQIGLDDPQLLWDAYGTLQNFLPGVEALVTGHGDEVLISQEMVDQAYDLWTRIAAAASPGLAATISADLAKYNNLQDFVGVSFDEWALAVGVRPPKFVYLPLVARGP